MVRYHDFMVMVMGVVYNSDLRFFVVQFGIPEFCGIVTLMISGFHPVVKLKMMQSVIPIDSYGFRIRGDFKNPGKQMIFI